MAVGGKPGRIGGVDDVTLAAVTAASTSASLPLGTEPIRSSVVAEWTAIVSWPAGAVHVPPM